ncbi:cell division protein FtsX [Oricola sp.]|uniref:cell division protein FtsX n=1 Tax=Oricola sp. TaxID=1979950 RepID=UPI003BAD05B0
MSEAAGKAGAKRWARSRKTAARSLPGQGTPELRPLVSIVPKHGTAGQALVLVIAIMSFLACLTIGAVSLVNQSARTWQSQISREATIQIRPSGDQNMESALQTAQGIALGFAGVRDARIIGGPETVALLEPWLGSGLSLDELPVPRLVVVTIDDTAPPDFAALRSAIEAAIPEASLDDHRAWVGRLVGMARTATLIGLSVLSLVMVALVFTVIFATRGAMSGNQHVIEVLHFIGARAGFVAGQFQSRFLMSGIVGALIGGGAAVSIFLLVGIWASRNIITPEGEMASAFFGDFSIGASAYAGVAGLVVFVGLLTALTTRLTVLRALRDIDDRRSDPGRLD